jgi:hypothetical protein
MEAFGFSIITVLKTKESLHNSRYMSSTTIDIMGMVSK